MVELANYKKGNIITGSITGIEKYGAFVSLDEYYKGLIHISEISQGFVRNISDYVNVGDTIKAKVIDVDEETFHLKLSIKDINYKIKKEKNNSIEESGSGFGILKDNLSMWIFSKKVTKNDKF